jgi:hypothetical protein
MDCRWDPETKAWYHFDKETAAKAQDLVTNGVEKHYIPEIPYKLNEQIKQMGCRWDAEARCWYHTDPEISKAANRLVQETREILHGHDSQHSKSAVIPASTAEVEHGL